MRTLIKSLIFSPLSFFYAISSAYASLLEKRWPSLSDAWLERILQKKRDSQRVVLHKNRKGQELRFVFLTPNWICRWRAETFSTKEPETLAWIDEMGGKGAFYDIGANVGLYSIYHAASHNSNVYAFEPSIFNLPVLARNIYNNGVQNKVHIVTTPLSENNGFADFTLSSMAEGGALAGFGVDYGHNHVKLEELIKYQTLGFSLDYMVENKIIPEPPRMIKVDVDGIEHLIIAGAKKTLSMPECKTILIEVSDSTQGNSQFVTSTLKECGFTLSERHLAGAATSTGNAYNQVWVKT